MCAMRAASGRRLLARVPSIISPCAWQIAPPSKLRRLISDRAVTTRVNMHDRKYFYSLYVREPAGGLIELASDGPGFAIDEPPDTLGSQLFIPEHFHLRPEDIVPMLPQFGLPGEPRIIYRDLPFVHRIHAPEAPNGSTLVLLHGTGGNEASLCHSGARWRLPPRLLV